MSPLLLDTTWDSKDTPIDPLAALRDGDPGPFEAFVVTHARRLVGFFRRRGASYEEAEDLTQDVLLKLHGSAANYQPRERFGAYVARVAQNQLIDARRRSGSRLRPLSLDSDGESGESALGIEAAFQDPLEPLSNAEQVERVREAVADLSNAHQSVFELAIVEELSYAEIGALLGCPVGTVKSRVFHLVRLLRERLTPTDDSQ